MRNWSQLSVVGCLTLLGIAACSDVPPTAPKAAPQGATQAQRTTPAVPLGEQIQTEINALFPLSEATSLTYRWNKVLDELAEAQAVISRPVKYKSEIDRAHELLVSAVTYIQTKTYKITPPPGETKAHAASRLALLMSLYVYNGPDASVPVVPAASDAVLAIVQPSATLTTTVQTPTLHAAVQFPPGSLGETRIVVIAQEMTPYPVNCSGPLVTRLCQYPQFYEFNVFPDTKLLSPATVAVCHVNSGDARAPLADHDRFRIAHDAPADPANRVEGGTIEDGIEMLPFVVVSGLTSCEGNSYQVGMAPAAPAGALGRALQWMAAPVERVASALLDAVKPREAWAIDGLGGGRLSVFSTVAVVDPQGVPDLEIDAAPSVIDVSGDGGEALQIGSFSLRNTGTATAEDVSATVVAATDSLLTTGVIASASLDEEASALAPGATLSFGASSLDIPADAAAGSYFVGVRASISGESDLGESNFVNNLQSVRVNVGSVPLGSWARLSNAPLAEYDAASVVLNGTVYLVGGESTFQLDSLVESYNTANDAWATIFAPPPVSVAAATASLVQGKMYVAGGEDVTLFSSGNPSDFLLASVLIFDPSEDVWSFAPPMSEARRWAMSASMNSKLYVVGGLSAQAASSTVESLDPATGSWTTLAPMPTPRYGAGAAVSGGLLYVAGGIGAPGAAAKLEIYDPIKDAWSVGASMPTPRGDLCLTAINGLLYAVGGFLPNTTGNLRTATVEAYDPASNTWTTRAPLPLALSGASCQTVGGRLYVIGGTQTNGPFLSSVEVYTP